MILVKAGGGKNINWEFIARDIAELSKTEEIVIVHGASAIRNEIAEKLGSPTKTVISPSGIQSVFTDEQALDIFLMVYCGLVNKKIVALFRKHGVNAVGLSGVDGALWQAKAKKELYIKENGKIKLITNNRTGRVEKINTALIEILVNNKYLPVISSPAISFENEIVNTDNDWAAAIMAGALKTDKLVVLFEAPGMLKDFKDEKSVIANIQRSELDNIIKYAQGRMKKKVLGAKKAFELGVKKIYWGDGRISNPVIKALNGEGTIIS